MQNIDFSDSGSVVIQTILQKLTIPRLPCSLEFENYLVQEFDVREEERAVGSCSLAGSISESAVRFRAVWSQDDGGWVRFRVEFLGQPPKEWGRLLRVTVLKQPFPGAHFHPPLGWRQIVSAEEASAVADRPQEEGGGLLPRYGYPVFATDFFLGLEHPMACVEVETDGAHLYHHPQWGDDGLTVAALVIGLPQSGETTQEAFLRYFDAIRIPQPARAIVELNTFWTDQFVEGSYHTDLPSYGRFAQEWSERILAGERGLISHLMLDAGWYTPQSIFRPTAINGGPGDSALAELGRQFERLGFELGLWFTINGPIGIDMEWAAAQGYRTSNAGIGSGYSCRDGKLSYVCPTDPQWEQDFIERFEELIDRVPVTFFKGDWDNDAVEDPTWDRGMPYHMDRLREAVANAMIRIYDAMRARRPNIALRGAWWLSPWWFRHVNNTHLPGSGDHEPSDRPSLTQRDSGVTCRDGMYHHVMVKSKTPIPFDVICGHEFASSFRNPVQDTEDSWMNNLAMWVSRGSHYIQLYLAPYGVHGWKAWSIREALRWFRLHEDLLWKAPTTMLGGDPLEGQPYGYHHVEADREILTIRNPLARPQWFDLSQFDLGDGDWVEVFPFYRGVDFSPRLLASHGVVILTRGIVSAPRQCLLNTSHGIVSPAFAAKPDVLHGIDAPLPPLHDLGPLNASVHEITENGAVFHLTVPAILHSAELVVQFHSERPEQTLVRAAVSRYPSETSTFQVPVTVVQPNPRVAFAQKRIKAPPADPGVVIVRVPVGTGGNVHVFLTSDGLLPEIQGAWMEGCFWNAAPQGVSAESLPPAPEFPRQALCEIQLPSR